jgi:hypothetical protein
MDQLNLLSEEKLLLYCSRLSISYDIRHKIEKILNEDLDWNYIMECSRRQGISPLFYWNLKKVSDKKDVPFEVMKKLERIYYSNLARNMMFFNELGKTLKAFKKVGIETVVLKGVFLAEEIYKNIGLRPMSDIDLLIKEEDVEKAKEELSKLNYFAEPVIVPTKLHKKFYTALHEELQLVNQNKEIMIEIHWDIQPIHNPYKVDIKKLWDNVKPVKIAGVDVLTFAPEDTLQYLCLHMDKHINLKGAPANKPLRDFCDIAEVTRYYNEIINWNLLLQNSKSFKTEEPVYQGLYIAKKYFDAFVPESILRELETVKPKIGFEEIFKGVKYYSNEKIQWDETSYLIDLRRVKGTWNKAFIALGQLFPSKQYMMHHYPIKNEKQIFKYYLFRSGTAFRLGLAVLWESSYSLLKSTFGRQ